MLSNKLTLQALMAGTALLATTLAADARAQSVRSFDGPWSVMIVTDYGQCDRVYRFGVQISDGRVSYEGGMGADVYGRVNPRGQVSVQVRQGDHGASGTGRLTQVSGGGRWSGSSFNQQCGGHWIAQRREY